MKNNIKKAIIAGSLALAGYAVMSLFSERPDSDIVNRLGNRPALTAEQHAQSRKYAVLINGDTREKGSLHRANILESYKTLRAMKADDRDIFILTTDYPRADDGKSITTRATGRNLIKVFDYLEKVCDSNDTLTIYTTGHGGKEGNESILELEDCKVYESEFADLITKTGFLDVLSVSDQCYSGGFAEAISKIKGKKIMAISSTDSSSLSECEYFAQPFWCSFRSRVADYNGDGAVTADEAFTYAAAVNGEGYIFLSEELSKVVKTIPKK